MPDNRDFNGVHYSIVQNAGGVAGHIHGCTFETGGRYPTRVGRPREDGTYELLEVGDVEDDASKWSSQALAGILTDRLGGYNPRGLVVAASAIAASIACSIQPPTLFMASVERDGYIEFSHVFNTERLRVRVYPDHHPILWGDRPFSQRRLWFTADAEWNEIPNPTDPNSDTPV